MRAQCPWCGEVDRSSRPESVLRATPAKLARLVRGMSDEAVDVHPGRGEWSVRQVLVHMADTEVAQGYRLLKMLAEETPDLQAYDEGSWAKGLGYERRDPAASLATFRALRGSQLDLLGTVSEEAMERTGLHSEVGLLSVAQLIGHMADHDLIHLAQIEQTLAAVARA